jgi:hypothetical protein
MSRIDEWFFSLPPTTGMLTLLIVVVVVVVLHVAFDGNRRQRFWNRLQMLQFQRDCGYQNGNHKSVKLRSALEKAATRERPNQINSDHNNEQRILHSSVSLRRQAAAEQLDLVGEELHEWRRLQTVIRSQRLALEKAVAQSDINHSRKGEWHSLPQQQVSTEN